MPLTDIDNSEIIIISDNDIIYNVIADNTSYKLKLINENYLEYLNNSDVISILIFDKYIKTESLPLYKIQNIINCTNKHHFNNEIILKKPIKLEKLLFYIANFIEKSNNVFCTIDKDWIYDEQNMKLKSVKNEIIFTEKENQIFKSILMHKNLNITKEFLKQKLWDYHVDSETNTIDTHLYKLKKKLPSNWLEITRTGCKLAVDIK